MKTHTPILLVLALALAGCSERAAPAATTADPAAVIADAPATLAAFNPRLLRRFRRLRSVFDDPARSAGGVQVELGRMLYFEKRLSGSHEMSCNTCHPLDKFGVDGEITSAGHKHVRGERNTPSVYHAAGMVAEFWDGRSPDVEAQAAGPITNALEMGSTAERVVETLRSIPEYRERFAKAFPGTAEPITLANVGVAIGAFERGLVTPGRWDRYLDGETGVLDAAEVEGLRLFTNVGCMVCHTGELLGGSSFQRVGAVEPWPNQADRGRGRVTGSATDDMVFRVPSLRNVAQTAPYFHDGSAATLELAVTMMARHQLGLELSVAEVKSIATWLRSLTGELPHAYIAEPALPPSTATTPKADP